MKQFVIAGSVTATALAVLLAACRVTIEVGPDVPLLGGTKVEIVINPLTGNASVQPSDGLNLGDCVKVTFTGANGADLGSIETKVGDEFPPPAGTKDIGVSPCEPKPEKPVKKTKNRRRAGAPARFVAQDDLNDFAFCYVPFDLTGNTHHYADFQVSAHTRAEADQIASDFVFGMLSETPPAGVEPGGVVEVEVAADSSVRVSMYSTEEPVSLSFTWNDAPLFELEDAVVMPLNGWFVTTVVVPAPLVDVDLIGSSDNGFRYQLGLSAGRHVGSDISVSIAQ